VGLVVLHRDARSIFDSLMSDGLALVVLSLVCGLGVLVLLRRGARRGTRVLAAGAVVAVIWGWAVAQHPYLLPPSLTVSEAAAPHETLIVLLIVFGVAVLAVLPSLGLLYTLVQRNLVEETSQPSRRPPEDTVAGV
jgi:cytochrome d ubiquinol oxidase subunit II